MNYDESAARKFALHGEKSRKTFQIRWRRPLAAIVFAAIAACGLSLSEGAERTYSLAPDMTSVRSQRVQVAVDAQGELRLNAKGSEITKQALKVVGNLDYEERLLPEQPKAANRKSCRYYETAQAAFHVGNGGLSTKLSDSKRLILAQVSQNQTSLSSLAGLLTRDEFELLNVQANSLLLDALLPAAAVKVGQTWKVPDHSLAALLGIDVLTSNDCEFALDRVENGVARLSGSGTVSGAASGVASEIELSAKLVYDIAARQVTSFTATIQEQRAIGHAQPGFDVTAKLQVLIEPLAQPRVLTADRIANLEIEKRPLNPPLAFTSAAGRFRLHHDPRWHCMLDRHDLTVFRFIDAGDLIAQCNISDLPNFSPSAPDKRMTLEIFQSDVQKSLGVAFGEFIEATQAERADGRRTLRVVVSGNSSGVAVQWLYYHLSQRDGRQVAVAFTLEQSLAERFAGADEAMVESLELLPKPPAQASAPPAPAKPLPPLRK